MVRRNSATPSTLLPATIHTTPRRTPTLQNNTVRTITATPIPAPPRFRQISARPSLPPSLPPLPSIGPVLFRFARCRQQALKDLDFVWADQGGGSSAWACGWVPAADMPDHLVHSCPLRSAPCREGCGQSLVVMQDHSDRHYQDHCPKRLVPYVRLPPLRRFSTAL